MEQEIVEKYGNKVRFRASGLCWKGYELLMVNHQFLTNGDFWAPPGGGIEFGQSAYDTLVQEFREETGISITPGNFLFGCEYIKKPLHSVELFFEVFYQGGNISTGFDPESSPGKQIIREVRYMEFSDITAIPAGERHGIFRFVKNADELKKLKGFYRI